MDPSSNGAVRKSIECINAGHIFRAREVLLREVLHDDADNSSAWAFLAHLALTRREAITCLEQVVRLKPSNTWAQSRLRNLRNEKTAFQQMTVTSTPPFYPAELEEVLRHGWSTEFRRTWESTKPSKKRVSKGWGIIPEFQHLWPPGLKFRSLDEQPGKEIGRQKSSWKLGKLFQGSLDTLLMMAVVLSVVLLLAPRLMGSNLLVVLSQSMEPTIPMGSVVVSHPQWRPDDITVGDVITFRAMGPDGQLSLVTHRVVETIGNGIGQRFRTKGDAVEEPDMVLVDRGNLIGRVWFSVPVVGYLVAFVRTPAYLAMVGIPALLLIADEWRTILVALRRREKTQAVKVPLNIIGGGR